MNHFDNVAHIYDETLPSHVMEHYTRRRAAFLAGDGIRPAEGRLGLEVGAGTGTLGARVEWNDRLVASDLSFEMIKKAPIRRKLQFSGAALPFKSDSFDLVYSVATMHHIFDQKDFLRAVSEMVRVASRGGRIVIWDHNPLNPYWPFLMARVPQDQEPTRLRSAKIFREALERAGARVEKIHRWGWMPDFCPKGVLPAWSRVESFLEAVPLFKEFSAHSVVVGVKL